MECIKIFIENMKKLGYSMEDCIKFIEKYWQDNSL